VPQPTGFPPAASQILAAQRADRKIEFERFDAGTAGLFVPQIRASTLRPGIVLLKPAAAADPPQQRVGMLVAAS
jgi:hypothetical protein